MTADKEKCRTLVMGVGCWDLNVTTFVVSNIDRLSQIMHGQYVALILLMSLSFHSLGTIIGFDHKVATHSEKICYCDCARNCLHTSSFTFTPAE